MGEFRVFLRSEATSDEVLAALEALRPFDVLDGPINEVHALGVRAKVLAELVNRHEEREWSGVPLDDLPRFVRFVGMTTTRDTQPSPEWVAAHAFLWIVTRLCDVDEAVLTGTDAEPLHFRDGRIHRAPEQRFSED